MPQLVGASPSATEDGALLLGSQQSTVYVVDGTTGALLSVLPFEQGMLAAKRSGRPFTRLPHGHLPHGHTLATWPLATWPLATVLGFAL